MALRGTAHRAAVRLVLDTFGTDADGFVLIGGCVLRLYARDEGAPLRATKDVDCVSLVTPWVLLRVHEIARSVIQSRGLDAYACRPPGPPVCSSLPRAARATPRR